jgi:hypothetical protein
VNNCRGSTTGLYPRFLNLSARASRSVEGGKKGDDLIVNHVPESPGIDGHGSHVKEIENSQANQDPGPPWQTCPVCWDL